MWRVSLLVINAKYWSWISLDIIKHDPVCVISDRMDGKHTFFLLHLCYKNVLKCDLITCNSLQNITITPEMDSPYSNNPKPLVLKLWQRPTPKGAILDLSNMAATAVAQLGSLEKLACYGHIYTWSKIGAYRPIWTINVFLKIKPTD